MRLFGFDLFQHGEAVGRRTTLAYVVVLPSTVILLLLRLGVGEMLQYRGPIIVFLFSVTLSAWLGGLGPGLFATTLSTVVAWYGPVTHVASTAPRTPAADAVLMAVYFSLGLAISAVCERMHRAVEQAAKQAAALRESEDRARRQLAEIQAIYDTAPVGLCVVDTDLRWVRINERLAQLNGFAVTDHIGKAPGELLPDVAGAIEPSLRSVLATGEPVIDLEISGAVPSSGGGARIWSTSHYPLRGAGGEIVGVNVVYEEITDKKRAGTEREHLLESERAARAEAEHANRMKDDFLAVISHELRTPLNAVLGWAGMLRRPGRTAEKLEKGLEVIERNARLQAQLISDLLDVSRIISGKIHLDVQPVMLEAVVEAGVDALRAAASTKGVELRAAIMPLEVSVHGDPARLQQVVTNLLSNAIKFTPKGGVVEVSLAQSGDHVEIAVRDTGAGVSPAFLPHVFDRFRQADPSITRQHGGLGLGLAIVRHLVDLHGGTARGESEGLGEGATFTVSLPCEATLIPAEAPARVAARPASLRGLRVVVLDDEADARDLVARLLEEHEATVESASSAEQALALLRRRAPDVLVSDIGMPGMDGYALIRALRRGDADGARDVPAVALTAFARVEDRDRALAAGYQAHLAKPFDPTELVATVARLSVATRTSRASLAAAG